MTVWDDRYCIVKVCCDKIVLPLFLQFRKAFTLNVIKIFSLVREGASGLEIMSGLKLLQKDDNK